MFNGRIKELEELNRRYNSEVKEFGIIYGRRRIGKSALIDKFMSDRTGLVFQAKQDSSYGNLKSFSYLLDKITGLPKNFVFSGWEEALDAVTDHFRGKRFVLVIDEYPYIVSQDKSFPSVLQDYIDHAPSNAFILLSGSNVSFMEKEINNEKSPLYKRKTFSMELDELRYEEAVSFVSSYPDEEKAAFLALFGGYPYYLSAIDQRLSFENNIKRLIFNEYGIFFNLPDQVLSNSTKSQDVYNAILQSIAYRHRTIGTISQDIHEEMAKVSKYLDTLISIGIVEKMDTFLGNKKTNYYEIKDPLLRVWYNIVFKNQERLRLNADFVFDEIKNDVYDLINHGFENVCHMYIDWLNRSGKLGKIYPAVKNYRADNSKLGRSVEIDGVAQAGNDLLIIDCKFRNKSYSKALFDHLKESTGVFADSINKHYYIFSKNGFADDMKNVKDAIKIDLRDLFLNLR